MKKIVFFIVILALAVSLTGCNLSGLSGIWSGNIAIPGKVEPIKLDIVLAKGLGSFSGTLVYMNTGFQVGISGVVDFQSERIVFSYQGLGLANPNESFYVFQGNLRFPSAWVVKASGLLLQGECLTCDLTQIGTWEIRK